MRESVPRSGGHAPQRDVPHSAYAKAAAAIADFDSAVDRYTAILDSTRVLLGEERIEEAIAALERGSIAMQSAVRAGRRLMPLDGALRGDRYTGPRARAIITGVGRCRRRGIMLAELADAVAVQCAIRREDAVRALAAADPRARAASAASTGQRRALDGYTPGPASPRLIDLRR